MKTIIAVDLVDRGITASTLTARLAFAPPRSFDLVHVIEPLPWFYYGEISPDATVLTRVLEDQESSGKSALEECRNSLQRLDIGSVQTMLLRGNAAGELLRAADTAKAGLIAVGGPHRGVFERTMLGGVSQKIVSAAACSVLLAKEEPLSDRPLRALFATDHSPYADRCVDLLAQMAPRGIGELIVFSAYSPDYAAALATSVDKIVHDVRGWVAEKVGEANRAVVTRLGALPCKLSSRVAEGPPVASIKAALAETGADLLIVGAQGHGFLDRLFVGSVSHALATKGDHHTLVLRP